MKKAKDITKRLEQLRQALRSETMSYGELHELQSLIEYIEPGDAELLEWAGVPEFSELPAPANHTKELLAALESILDNDNATAALHPGQYSTARAAIAKAKGQP